MLNWTQTIILKKNKNRGLNGLEKGKHFRARAFELSDHDFEWT